MNKRTASKVMIIAGIVVMIWATLLIAQGFTSGLFTFYETRPGIIIGYLIFPVAFYIVAVVLLIKGSNIYNQFRVSVFK